MTIPSGGGSEVLMGDDIAAMSNSPVSTLITGEANHIYTVVSITFCEQGDQSNERIRLYLTDTDGSSNPIYLLMDQAIGAQETFVWNDRFSWQGTQKLIAHTLASADIDVHVTWIEQDWG